MLPVWRGLLTFCMQDFCGLVTLESAFASSGLFDYLRDSYSRARCFLMSALRQEFVFLLTVTLEKPTIIEGFL